MAFLTTVDDVADPRVDDFRDLTAADRRPDRPGGRGLVIAEGVVVVRRLLDSPYPVRSLLGVPRRLAELDLSAVDAPAYAADADTMARIVGFHLNRGVLAVADRAPTPSVADLSAGRLLAVLEGVNDHENLGALFRNAARARRRRRAARPPLRRSALPAQRAGLHGARAAGAVRAAPRAVAGRPHGARPHDRRTDARARRRAAGRRGSRRPTGRAAARRGGPGPVRGGAGGPRTCACGSRWRRASTLSMWLQPPPLRSTRPRHL